VKQVGASKVQTSQDCLIEERLAKCFKTAFPKLSDSEIQTADVSSVPSWDSIATLTVIALVEEEFSVELDVAAAEDLLSFRAIKTYLLQACGTTNHK
jgi:acyl carrier protein